MLLTKRLDAEALAAAEFLTASVALPICFLISSDLVFVVLVIGGVFSLRFLSFCSAWQSESNSSGRPFPAR